MADYHITWLVAIFGGVGASLAVIALGCYTVKGVVEDLSNSVALSAFVLRIFRITPGASLIIFGSILLWKMVHSITSIVPPNHLP